MPIMIFPQKVDTCILTREVSKMKRHSEEFKNEAVRLAHRRR